MEKEIVGTKLKNVELEILDAVDFVCKRLNIRYFLIGGTLLGAVRHKGFIPWDDDIDIGMLRSDYNRFLNEAQNLLPEYLFLQTFKTDRYYPNNFAKIRNSKTTFIEKTLKNIKINHGVYIDVFPLDNYPDTFFREKFLSFQLLAATIRINEIFFCDNPSSSIKLKIARFFSRIIYPNYSKAVLARERLICSQKKTTLVRNYGGAWGKREIFPANYFNEFCKMSFEGRNFWVPKMYHEILSQMYGDYMTPPPVEKRVAHHYTEVIDLDKPYTAYVENKEN